MANMFGALNRFISRLDSGEPLLQQGAPETSTSNNAYGFQVLRNNSTLNLPLEPWFDFIIGINNHSIDNGDPTLLATEIRNCAGSTISLGVYSLKGQQIREIYAPIPVDGAALGLSLQWAPLSLADDVWHVLDVLPNSPADAAGLLPYGDYVIGSPDASERDMHGESALSDLVESFIDHPLRLYVYNHEYDVARTVTITPSTDWAGSDGAALGCILGYGALHRIPAPLEEPSQEMGETLFESDETFIQPAEAQAAAQDGTDFLIPANMAASTPASTAPLAAGPPPPGKARKQRAHHNVKTPASGLDDYFAEGEQKSQELEKGSTPKPSAALPPPPKGGPPKATSPAPTE